MIWKDKDRSLDSPRNEHSKLERHYCCYHRNKKDNRDYHEQIHANKLINIEEMEKFLNIQAETEIEIENLDRPVTVKEIVEGFGG